MDTIDAFHAAQMSFFSFFLLHTGDQLRYQGLGQGPGGSSTQAQAAWQTSSSSSMSSASVSVSHSRIKHSVNLSLDSLYQALNSADEEYHDSDGEGEFYSSTAGSAWEDHEHDHELFREHDESDTNTSPLIPAPPAPVRRVGSNPALSTTYSGNLNGAYGSAAPSTADRSTSPQTLPPGRITRNHYAAQPPPPPTLLSPTSASGYHQQQQQILRHHQHQYQQHHQYPSRLGIPRTRTSDSDLSGTASTTSTSTRSSSGLSPITPETPPLPTPVDPFGAAQASFFSKHAGGGGGGGVLTSNGGGSAPLSAIEETSMCDDDSVCGTRAHTPNANAAPDSAAWKERLRAGPPAPTELGATATGGYAHAHPHPPPSPLSPGSPAISIFSDTHSHAHPRSPDAVSASETRHTSFTRSLFSRSSKSAKSATATGSKKAPPPSLLSSSTASSADADADADPSMWSDARDVKKAAKAAEKRRKKDAERARIEQLALQLKASAPRAGAKDGHSTLSGSSEERRRQANKWLEETDGLYGGAINTWGGL